MIVVDIINSIFDILPQLILATSPVCIFSGMGSGSQSGKLTFKKIFSGDGVNIVEDINSLQFQVTGGSSIGVNSCEVVMGDATTGITGSNIIKVCQEYKAIHGVRIISGTFSPSSYSLCNQSPNSIIIGGRADCIKSYYSQRTNIVGGDTNTICAAGPTYRNYGTILGGRSNLICENEGGVIITSRLSCIRDNNSPFNSIIGGLKNEIYGVGNGKYHSIIGGCCNRIYEGKHSSIINSNCVTSSYGDFNTSIGSKGQTKLQGNFGVDISGVCNVINSTTCRQVFLSSINSTSKSGNDLSSVISSCNIYIQGACSSVAISSICNVVSASNFSTMISSCISKILNSEVGFNTILSSSCGRIVGSTGSSIISSYGATVSNSDCSLIISSNRSIIKDSMGSVLFSLAGNNYKNQGIYNSTSSVAIFQKCGIICSSLNSVMIGGSNNTMLKSIDSGSIGLNGMYQGTGTSLFTCRNFILSFDGAGIRSEYGNPTNDNFASGYASSIIDSNLSSVASSYLIDIRCSNSSSIIGSYYSQIVSSTSSAIIGSRCTIINKSINSAIIAGWPGSSLISYCETLRTAHLQVSQGVSVNNVAAVSYCNWTGNINSITVCRGIITAIS